jgi:hypothetical protein
VKNYPDIKEIIKNKAAHRRALAELSFEEKLDIVFRLSERRKLIKSGRRIKKALRLKDAARKLARIAN